MCLVTWPLNEAGVDLVMIQTGKEAKVNRVEWELTQMIQDFFRSFWLEREKRNTSEDFHLFRKLPGRISCTI